MWPAIFETRAARWLALHRPAALALVFWIAGLAIGCHRWQLPRYFLDSATYIHWESIRLPGYCLFVTVFGHQQWLVLVQTALSLTAWAVLGWSVARAAGVAAAVCLALASTVFQWNLCCLSESLSLSLLALLAAQTLRLLNGGGKGALGGWALLAAAAGLTRLTNVYVLPFFVLPLLARGWRRWVFPAAAALAVYVVVASISEQRAKEYQRLTLTDVLMFRILPDPDAVAFFASRGMPADDVVRSYAGRATKTVQDELFAQNPEFRQWVDENGKRVYQSWLLASPRRFVDAWRGILYYRIRLPWAGIGVTLPAASFRLRWAYYHLGRAPAWLWLTLAFAPLGVALARARHPLPSLALLGAALVPITLAMGFVSYHGECVEMPRLMMPTGLLYRVTLLVGIAACVQACAARRRPRPQAIGENNGG